LKRPCSRGFANWYTKLSKMGRGISTNPCPDRFGRNGGGYLGGTVTVKKEKKVSGVIGDSSDPDRKRKHTAEGHGIGSYSKRV